MNFRALLTNFVVAFILVLVMAPTKEAQAQAGAKNVTTLSLDDFIVAFRKTQSLSSYTSRLDVLRASKVENAGRRIASPVALGFEAEGVLGEENERSITGSLKQSITIGIDRNILNERYSAEAQADLSAKKSEQREQEKELALVYTKARLQQHSASIAIDILSALEPLVKTSRRAAEQGTLGGFFARRWQLFLGSVEADYSESDAAFSALLKSLRMATGTAAGETGHRVVLKAVEVNATPAGFSPALYLPVVENLSRQKALASQAAHVRSRTEIGTGLGVQHDFATRKNSIVLEVEIPINSRQVTSSEARELTDERGVLAAEADLAVQQAENQYNLLLIFLEKARSSRLLADQRATNLANLYADARKAFDGGKAEIGEVIETLSELYDARLKLAEKTFDVEESAINVRYFLAGEEF